MSEIESQTEIRQKEGLPITPSITNLVEFDSNKLSLIHDEERNRVSDLEAAIARGFTDEKTKKGKTTRFYDFFLDENELSEIKSELCPENKPHTDAATFMNSLLRVANHYVLQVTGSQSDGDKIYLDYIGAEWSERKYSDDQKYAVVMNTLDMFDVAKLLPSERDDGIVDKCKYSFALKYKDILGDTFGEMIERRDIKGPEKVTQEFLVKKFRHTKLKPYLLECKLSGRNYRSLDDARVRINEATDAEILPEDMLGMIQEVLSEEFQEIMQNYRASSKSKPGKLKAHNAMVNSIASLYAAQHFSSGEFVPINKGNGLIAKMFEGMGKDEDVNFKPAKEAKDGKGSKESDIERYTKLAFAEYHEIMENEDPKAIAHHRDLVTGYRNSEIRRDIFDEVYEQVSARQIAKYYPEGFKGNVLVITRIGEREGEPVYKIMKSIDKFAEISMEPGNILKVMMDGHDVLDQNLKVKGRIEPQGTDIEPIEVHPKKRTKFAFINKSDYQVRVAEYDKSIALNGEKPMDLLRRTDLTLDEALQGFLSEIEMRPCYVSQLSEMDSLDVRQEAYNGRISLDVRRLRKAASVAIPIRGNDIMGPDHKRKENYMGLFMANIGKGNIVYNGNNFTFKAPVESAYAVSKDNITSSLAGAEDVTPSKQFISKTGNKGELIVVSNNEGFKTYFSFENQEGKKVTQVLNHTPMGGVYARKNVLPKLTPVFDTQVYFMGRK